jgi:hypothetical protein
MMKLTPYDFFSLVSSFALATLLCAKGRKSPFWGLALYGAVFGLSGTLFCFLVPGVSFHWALFIAVMLVMIVKVSNENRLPPKL